MDKFSKLTAIILLAITISCDEKDKSILNESSYDGPYIEMMEVTTFYSDSAVIRLKMISPVQQIFDNGDENYPKGIYLEIYDEDHKLRTTYRSNTAEKKADEKYYIGRGNVIVNNLENGDELNTEELYWYQEEKKFSTEKFVTIKSDGELHTGEGLEANQDFTYYTIKKPTGTLSIDDPSAF